MVVVCVVVVLKNRSRNVYCFFVVVWRSFSSVCDLDVSSVCIDVDNLPWVSAVCLHEFVEV